MDDEPSTIYFDRLQGAIRSTEEGMHSTIDIGDGPGSCALRIRNDFEERKDDQEQSFGIGATTGLTLYMLSTKKLEARIENNIELVSSCGKVVTIPFRCLQTNVLRFYSLTFFHAALAQKFCEVYQRYLPSKRIQSIRYNYDTLVSRSRLVEEAQAIRAFKKSSCEVQEVEAVVSDKDEVLSDVGDEGKTEEGEQQEQGYSRRKRKRLNPVEDEDEDKDPHGFNEDFYENQFGFSQQC